MRNRTLDSGREKQRLPFSGNRRNDLFNSRQKAHVQHAVGLVKDKEPDTAQFQQLAADEVQQPARSRDQYLGACPDGLKLPLFVESAHDQCGTYAGVHCQSGKGLLDLDGKLSRGAQNNAVMPEVGVVCAAKD